MQPQVVVNLGDGNVRRVRRRLIVVLVVDDDFAADHFRRLGKFREGGDGGLRHRLVQKVGARTVVEAAHIVEGPHAVGADGAVGLNRAERMIRQIPVHMRLDHLTRLLVVDADEPVALLARAHRVDEVQALDGFVLHALKTRLAVGHEQLFGHLLQVRRAEFIQRKQ